MILFGDEPAPWLNGFDKPVLRAKLRPIGDVPTGPLVAFAGIGRPEKFFDTLMAMKAEVSEALPFPDHHAFSESDRILLDRYAQERKATLITTEKDYARLPPDWRAHVKALPVAATFADAAPLNAALAPLLARAREAR